MPALKLEFILKSLKDNPVEFIEKCEDAYKSRIMKISRDVSAEKGRTLVMLAGPSSSGKTTTAKLLKEDLISLGRRAAVISLDDFYLGDMVNYTFEDGTVDYETVNALDLPLITQTLRALTEKGEADVPHFSFHLKRRDGFKRVCLEEDEIVIVEGLHALNPLITEPLEGHSMKKLYVSVSSRVTEGEEVFLTKRDIRFIRRLIRDFHHRSSSAENTFYLWKGVRMGEDRYLFPFKNRADEKINSIHPYEFAVFAKEGIKILDGIPKESVYYPSALALSEKLRAFSSFNITDIPESSLLMEFIG